MLDSRAVPKKAAEKHPRGSRRDRIVASLLFVCLLCGTSWSARASGLADLFAFPSARPLPGLLLAQASSSPVPRGRAIVFTIRQVGRNTVRGRIYRRMAAAVVDELRLQGLEAILGPKGCNEPGCALAAARAAGGTEAWTGTVSVIPKVYAKGRVHHVTLSRWDVASGKLLGRFDKYAELHYHTIYRSRCQSPQSAWFIGCGNKHLLYILHWLTRFIMHPPARPKPIPQAPVPPHATVPGMAYVPEGPFIMGGYFGEFDEAPEHIVTLSAYYIDKYETSNREYRQCVRAHRCHRSAYSNVVYLMHPDQPVLGVSWYDARDYCRFRGKRLPTEAEMEKAARGTDGRRYPWGNQFDRKRLNLRGKEDGYQWTAPVTAFAKGQSPYGVFNISGNVWEWCYDLIDKKYYEHSPARDPKGPLHGKHLRRCMRGGTWMYNVPFYASTTNRSPQWPWKRYKFTGIRCALSAKDRAGYMARLGTAEGSDGNHR